MPEYFIGLMSGTSMDGIDAALVEFSENNINLIASHSHTIPAPLKKHLKLLSLNSPHASIDMLGEADTQLGRLFAEATHQLLKQSQFKAERITAIGSHGQTIRHRPDLNNRFSMQIGDANQISYLTGITTVADFRRKDMAAGGEGAPLTPAFHQQVFYSTEENRAILNIGGIANITYLPKDKNQICFGFGSGPGNMLMDAWIQKHHNKNYDENGHYAASGEPDKELVQQLMQDAFILNKPPKSTGREHYHLDWLNQQLKNFPELDSHRVQASLCQLTCDSIVSAIENLLPSIETLIICGGGIHNTHLINSIKRKLTHTKVSSSEKYGVNPDWVEAIAFAWLAKQTLHNQTANLPDVTGAKKAVVLGAIYPK